jgi:fermentation-respiration switch protein FrsA (DUF1100 family)
MKIYWKRTGIITLSALVGIYGVIVGELYFRQSDHLYRPKAEWKTTPASAGLRFEEVAFAAADGTKLSGWFVPAEGTERGVVLFFHGNYGNISYEMGPIGLYHQLSYSIFLIDYRGFGKSEGKPSEKGVAMDADAALAWLTAEKGYAAEKIVICGRSFGGAVAIPLAARSKPRALIAEAAFSSLGDIAADMHPYFPVQYLLKEKHDSESAIGRVTSPVFVAHSKDDDLIPVAHGRRLYAAANEPKTYFEFIGPHNNSAYPESQAMYRKGLEAFLDSLDKGTPGK